MEEVRAHYLIVRRKAEVVAGCDFVGIWKEGIEVGEGKRGREVSPLRAIGIVGVLRRLYGWDVQVSIWLLLLGLFCSRTSLSLCRSGYRPQASSS